MELWKHMDLKAKGLLRVKVAFHGEKKNRQNNSSKDVFSDNHNTTVFSNCHTPII